ncbi:hypothetical protein [Faecalimonas sp.]
MKIAFIIWACVGFIFIVMGIFDYFSEKPVGFWANTKTVPIRDVKKYNRATGKLFFCFGTIFVLLGLPLLYSEQNSSLILLSIIGTMFEVIGTMIAYMKIEEKYRRK